VPADSHLPSTLRRRSFLAATVAAAAVGPTLITACAAGGGGDGEEVTFLSYLPLETLSLAPELLAVAGGHFEENGLTVTLQPVKGSPQAMQTLLAGSGPITRVGQIDVMTAAAGSRQPLINIGTLTRGSSVRFVYSKDNVDLSSPEAMIGRTMGVPSEGGTSDKVVSLVLANAGLDPKQVTRQVVGLTPGTFTLVEENATILRGFMAGIRDALTAMVADESFDKTLKTLRGRYSFASLDDDEVARASLTEMRELWTGGDPATPLLVTDEAAWVAGYDELTAADVATSGGDATTWFDNGMLPEGAGGQ
jgi:NitT/TauT family transport system substrate-binding protein